MSSTRKFARGDKKNYSNEEKLALKIPPPAINIWTIFQPNPTIPNHLNRSLQEFPNSFITTLSVKNPSVKNFVGKKFRR